MAAGGYVGGVEASFWGNVASQSVCNAVTGRSPMTDADLDAAAAQAILIDGPLGAFGAMGERALWLRGLRGERGGVLGAEGELLTSRYLGVSRGGETIPEGESYSGYKRILDFPSDETMSKWGVVVESKNKAYLTNERGGQLSDFAFYAKEKFGAQLRVYHRPGATISSELTSLMHDSGEPVNIQFTPIPQQPFIIGFPMPSVDSRSTRGIERQKK
jgi:hypothetical protein